MARWRIRISCLGPVTSPQPGEIRWTVGVEVAEHTLRGLLDGFFDGQADWLTLNVPIGEVGTAFRVRFPEPPPTEEEMRLGVDASRVELDVDMNPWMRRMEAGFVDMADSVAAVVPFELALIGEEVSGNWSAIGDERVPSLTRERVDRHGGVLLGPATRQRLSPARMGVTLSSGLRWYPS